jgi:hypothetical protein
MAAAETDFVGTDNLPVVADMAGVGRLRTMPA